METVGGSQLFETAERGGVMKNGPLKRGGWFTRRRRKKFFIL